MSSIQRSSCKTAKRSNRSPALPRHSAKRLKRSSNETSAAEYQMLKANARRQSDQIAEQAKIIAQQQMELKRIKVAAAELQAKAILEVLGQWIFEEHEFANKKLPRSDRCPILSAERALDSACPSSYSAAVNHLSLPCECYIIGEFPSDLRLFVHQLYLKRAAKVGAHQLCAKICRCIPLVRKTLFIDRSVLLCDLIEQLFDDLVAQNHFLRKEFI